MPQLPQVLRLGFGVASTPLPGPIPLLLMLQVPERCLQVPTRISVTRRIQKPARSQG